MSGEHTPGPWFVTSAPTGRGFHVGPSLDGDETYPHSIVAGVRGHFLIPEREAEANARLISAAPDLLEALATMLRCAEAAGVTIGDMDAARAAIQKARG